MFWNKNLFFFKQNIFFKAVKPRQCVNNNVVFAGDKVDVRVELFNIIEPVNGMIRRGVVSCNIEDIGMDL